MASADWLAGMHVLRCASLRRAGRTMAACDLGFAVALSRVGHDSPATRTVAASTGSSKSTSRYREGPSSPWRRGRLCSLFPTLALDPDGRCLPALQAGRGRAEPQGRPWCSFCLHLFPTTSSTDTQLLAAAARVVVANSVSYSCAVACVGRWVDFEPVCVSWLCRSSQFTCAARFDSSLSYGLVVSVV